MGKIPRELTGQRFGRLTALERAPKATNNHHAQWRCRCDCGTDITVPSDKLTIGNTQSCGCLHRETMAEITRTLNFKHGAAVHSARLPEYKAWTALRNRCSNPNNPGYINYGGRGITVCERWQGEHGFENFFEDMGRKPTPKHSIDRKENDGNYEPENCRWATKLEQTHNRRCSKSKRL